MSDIAIRESWSIDQVRKELAKDGIRVSLKRNKFNRTGLRDILLLIQDYDLQRGMIRLYEANQELMNRVCAGASWHHTDVGGLATHIREMIGWSLDQIELYPEDWTGVTIDDIIVACFLHDFGKIWFYRELTEEDIEQAKAKGRPYRDGQKFKGEPSKRHNLLPDEFLLTQELAKHNVILTDMQLSGIVFAEGGWSDYVTGIFGKPTYTGDMVMHKNKLAVLTHMADLFSSQVLSSGLR